MAMRRVPYTGGEKESLVAALDRHRDVVEWKLEGLTEEMLRRPMVPSGTSLLGIVKHLGSVEYGWFCDTLGRPSEAVVLHRGRPRRRLPPPAGRDRRRHPRLLPPGADRRGRVVAGLDLTDVGTAWHGATVTLRWVLIHMLEETARHAGHTDILRELLDGTTGDHPPG